MPTFHYKAKQGPGRIIEGNVEAPNRAQAISKIVQLGLAPLDIDQNFDQKIAQEKTPLPQIFLIKKIRLKDMVLFTRQMSDLVNASVPMLRSLQLVSSQTHNPHFKKIVDEIYAFIHDGGSFSDGLNRHPEVFSQLYIHLVKTGEVSGQLHVILKRLADYLEKEEETIQKVRASLAYPLFILSVGVLVVFILLTFVIPRISVIFDELNQNLPWPTLVLIQVSGIFAHFWWLILGVIAIVLLYIRQYLHSDSGRYFFDKFKLQVPALGEFIKLIEVARFSRTLGTLLENGVVITTALKSISGTINNVVLRNEVKKIEEDVRNGASLKVSLKQCSLFPEMAVNMVAVGEETGNLEQALYKVADTFERNAEQMSKTIISLLGPLVLLVIVVFVGFIVMAMLLPLLSMNLSF